MLFTPGASRASVGAPKLDRLRQRRGRSSCCVSARACVFEVLAVETALAAVRRTTKIQCAQTVVDGLHANFIRSSSRLSPLSRPFTVTSNSSFLPFSASPLVIHVRWCKERATLHVGFPLLCECTFMCACVFVCVCVWQIIRAHLLPTENRRTLAKEPRRRRFLHFSAPAGEDYMVKTEKREKQNEKKKKETVVMTMCHPVHFHCLSI